MILATSPRLRLRLTPWPNLSPRRRAVLLGWLALIVVLYMAIGAWGSGVIRSERLAADASHAIRLTPGLVEHGQTPPDPIPESGDFTPVTVGLYLDGIEAVSVRDSFWSPTFYIWFRWTGDRDLAPGANFRVIDARTDRKELVEEFHGPDNSHYQRWRVTARVTKFFNTTRVPLDGHMLNIYVEDGRLDASRLRYVADPATNLSSRARISGYDILGGAQVVKTHTYRTTYGDPRAEAGRWRTFSMFTYGVTIQRAGMGVYIKIFLGLFAGMALALTSFALRASDAGPRFSMLAGAYFGAVANSYLAGSLIPSSGQFGLVEYVTFLGMFTIFFSLIATIVSIYIWNILADKEYSRAFDRVTVLATATGYVVVNLVLPLSA